MRTAMALLLCILLFGCVSDIPENVEKNDSVQMDTTAENETLEPQDPPEAAPENTSENITLAKEPKSAKPEFDFNRTTENGTLKVYFFHSSGCSACRATYPLITELRGQYPDVIFVNHSLATVEGSWAYQQFAELHNLSKDKRLVPQVLINGTIITDRFNIEEKLEPIIAQLSEQSP